MEKISGVLYPYKNVIGILAITCSLLEHLSGIFVCYNVFKTKSTSKISSKIFIGNLMVAFLGLKFSTMVNDDITFSLYLASIILQSVYILVYWYYSKNRYWEVYEPLSFSTFVIGSAYGYAAYENPERLKFRFGLILTFAIFAVLAYPLQNLKRIIQEKDASSIPFPIILMSAVVSLTWFLYSLLRGNAFLMVQCVMSFIICIVQIILCIIYRKRHEE